MMVRATPSAYVVRTAAAPGLEAVPVAVPVPVPVAVAVAGSMPEAVLGVVAGRPRQTPEGVVRQHAPTAVAVANHA